jgi:uncharacterized protein YeeX (DUF496 family)
MNSIIEDLEKGSFPGWPEANWRIYLSEKADEAYRTNTIEGRLFSFLVFQQLAEELLLVAAENYIFELRCIIFPRTVKLKSTRDMTFGQIISYAKEVCPIDERLNRLLDQCDKLNQLRKRFIHKLLEFKDELKIMKTTEKARSIIRKINDAYDDIADHYRIEAFPFWQSRIEEMKKNALII